LAAFLQAPSRRYRFPAVPCRAFVQHFRATFSVERPAFPAAYQRLTGTVPCPIWQRKPQRPAVNIKRTGSERSVKVAKNGRKNSLRSTKVNYGEHIRDGEYIVDLFSFSLAPAPKPT
jgi:hypothetical protein